MNNEIQVTIRSVYGLNKAFPTNDQAANLAAMAGTKTVTARTLAQAKKMGFDIVVVGMQIDWRDVE